MRLAGKEKLGLFPAALSRGRTDSAILGVPCFRMCHPSTPAQEMEEPWPSSRADDNAVRYGIELDAYRADQARAKVHEVIYGNAFDVHCAVELFSLLYLNPPYHFECGEDHNRRMERVSLELLYRWLKPGGVLVFVIPGQRLCTCGRLLATHFRDKRV